MASLPTTFRLERTNFTAKATEKGRLSVDWLLSALRRALEKAGVDVLQFKAAHCVVSGAGGEGEGLC